MERVQETGMAGPDRPPNFLAKLARELDAGVSACFWLAARAPDAVSHVRVLVSVVIAGSTAVETPPDDPRIRTLIQADGDIVTIVHPAIFADAGWTDTRRRKLIEEHSAALERRLPPMDGAAPRLEAVAALLRRSHWIVIAFLGPAVWLVSASGPWAALVAREGVALGAPLALRHAIPAIVGFALRHHLLGRAHWTKKRSREHHQMTMDRYSVAP
jgi:hypothetical protein